MGEASYILASRSTGIEGMLGLTHSRIIEKVLKSSGWNTRKRGVLPMRHGIKLSKKQFPKTDEELKKDIGHPLCLSRRKHLVCCPVHQARCRYALGAYEQIIRPCAVQSILKYLRRTKDMLLDYGWW
ncbi:UNVERIFIED_CONTAM: hypothetical protein Sradi_7094200 [Sesamum radiatum]|uniref:Uncharacterized protein n=1 Tax=Sesamum radiatum TaxID=300843 RepID=A0AAW2J200_SESRA